MIPCAISSAFLLWIFIHFFVIPTGGFLLGTLCMEGFETSWDPCGLSCFYSFSFRHAVLYQVRRDFYGEQARFIGKEGEGEEEEEE